MAISLNIVLAGIIWVVVLSVAGATLGITIAVSLEALTSVGSERARSLTTDVSDLSSAYLNVLAFDATSTRDVTTMLGALPGDLAARGTNWTALYGSSMFTSLSDSNFTLFRARAVFDDGNWMHLLSACAVRRTSTCTAWWERTGTSSWAVGGKSVSRSTFLPDVGVAVEEAGFPINPDPWTASAVAIRTATNRQRSCVWEGLKYYHTAATGGLWVLTAGCNLVNSSGSYLGRVSYEAFVDRDLARFLNTVERSSNSVLFIIDSQLNVVASTLAQPYFTDSAATASTPVPAGCSSNADTDLPGTNLRIGCLIKSSNYPYSPLRGQDASFLNATGKSLAKIKVDGETFYAVSERINTQLPGYSFNVVLFSPESDVIGDVQRGQNIAIGVTAAVFFVGAAAAMLVTRHLLQALSTVSEQLYKMAKLDDDVHAGGGAGASGGKYANADGFSDDGLGHPSGTGQGTNASRDGGAGASVTGRPGAAAGADAAKGAVAVAADPEADRSVVSEFAALQSAYAAMNTAMRSFTKYVPKDVVRELMNKKELCAINMEQLRCTMLFCDIANFTTICEALEPHVVSELVKLYFERMSRRVAQHSGVVDKFIGDAIMVLWGAPSQIDQQELRGALCALGLQREARRDPLASAFAGAGQPLVIRVGVAAGNVLAGNMGSDKRMSYTVIGDAVNLAARLESFNRQWSTSTMVAEDLRPFIERWLVIRKLVFASIVGKETPCDVFEIVNMQPGRNDYSELDETAAAQAQARAGSRRPSATPVGPEANTHGGSVAAASAATSGRSTRNITTVRALVEYHQRHGVATQPELQFVARYSAAADALKRRRFADCVRLLDELVADASLPDDMRHHNSIAKLRDVAEAHVINPDVPTENMYNEFYVYRASEK
jgi:class 3 adenylate cyclase